MVSYSNNCCYVLKCADDTAILGLLSDNNDESSYMAQIEQFTSWCENNNLLLNAKKTKELIVDFNKCEPSYSSVIIGDSEVERVDKFK